MDDLDARVERLTAELDRTNMRWLDLRAELEGIDALRLPCLTCGGFGYGVDSGGMGGRESCPDCVDGYLSIPDSLAIAAEVMALPAQTDPGAAELLAHLRSVRAEAT